MVYTVTGTITPTPPFDFEQTLRFLAHFAPMEGEQALQQQKLLKAITIGDHPVAFQLASTGTSTQPKLAYTLYAEEPLTAAITEKALQRMRFFLSLDDDLQELYAKSQEDPVFAAIIQELYGYHQVKFLTPFECACWSILVQRNPTKIAHRMKMAIVEAYGAHITLNDIRYPAFPEASSLVDVSESELLAVVRNIRKANQLVGVIQAFNAVDEDFLYNAPYAEVESWLKNIKGFGEWSTSFILLRGLGRTEQIPLAEKPLQGAVARAYGHGSPLTRSQITSIAQRYGSMQGYWAHYLRVGA